MKKIDTKVIEKGINAGDSRLYEKDKIWSRFSHDKVDIGEELTKVIRTLSKAIPLNQSLRALSIGSSDEPQFRILETAFRGGLYLLDIDRSALDIVNERIVRQGTKHVKTIWLDYNKIFFSGPYLSQFMKRELSAQKVDLVTLHHSLYYSKRSEWGMIFEGLIRRVLSNVGAIHAVLMCAQSQNPYTTTWLYNYFAGRYFGCFNDQSLRQFQKELSGKSYFKNHQILLKTHHIKFSVDQFDKLMAVVWMILLYPEVHRYTQAQREEITEFIYKKFWLEKKPLIQSQDHLVFYRGIKFRGLV